MNDWISSKITDPDYFENVTIQLVDGSILDGWHRLSDGDNDYYGSLNTDEIIKFEDVVKWKSQPFKN